ncbi:hypothetical protein ACIBAI_13270 [Streptomyces sp. NPDC051041]|uniref:hypothetical protein n=1 Tax=Streptomyces sp. NPDC051041 TaxID=3365640 RepID=UPI0037BD1A25
MKLRSTHTAALRAALPVLFLAAVAGCGSSDGGSGRAGDAGTGGSAAARGGEAVEPLPLSAYSATSEEDEKTIQQASDLLMKECMQRFGFAYTPQPGVEEAEPARDSEYRMIPAADAAAHGYHSPDGGEPVDETGDDGKAGSEAENAVRLGTGARTVDGKAVPEGGCKGETDRTMAEGLPELPVPSPVDQAANEAAQKAQSDPKLTAAVAEWSACMKEQGFVFAHPRDAAGRFLGKGAKGDRPADGARTTRTATDEEKKVAVADSGCNEKAALEETWVSVMRPLEQAEIDERAEEFELLEEWHKGYVRNAQKALASS